MNGVNVDNSGMFDFMKEKSIGKILFLAFAAIIVYVFLKKKNTVTETKVVNPTGSKDTKLKDYVRDAEAIYKELGFDFAFGLNLPSWWYFNGDDIVAIIGDYAKFQYDNLCKVFADKYKKNLTAELIDRLNDDDMRKLSGIL